MTGDSSLEDCVPGGLRAGAFNPARNRWREVDLPSTVGANALQHSIQAIGSNSNGSLWQLNGRYWFRTKNGAWDTVPAAPFRPRSLCLVDDQVVAVGYTDDGTYEQHLNDSEETQGGIDMINPPPLQTASVVAAVLDLPAGHWKTVENTHVQGPAARYLNSTCAPDGAYVYSANIDEQVQSGFARYIRPVPSHGRPSPFLPLRPGCIRRRQSSTVGWSCGPTLSSNMNRPRRNGPAFP